MRPALTLLPALALAVTAAVAPAPTGVVQLHPAAISLGTAPSGAPRTTAACEQQLHVACYGAQQLQRAYDLPPLLGDGVDGRGQTIAIVDPFGSPTIQHDLAVFDQAYGLPDPRLTVIQPAGPVPPYTATGPAVGWAGETTLDVEWAHVMAPQAHLLLVETPTAETEGTVGFPDIVSAEKYVVDHHLASVISQSFSATEETFPTPQSLLDLRSAYQDAYRNHVTVLAATLDSGATDPTADGDLYTSPVTAWPASDPLVTAVGGTRLDLDADGDRNSPDVVWNDTHDAGASQWLYGDSEPHATAGGGGVSGVFGRPAYQDPVGSVTGDHRGLPDISLSGACDGAVNVYETFGGAPAGWQLACGTSEATPLFAGVVALAAQVAGHPLGLVNPALYALSQVHAPGLTDVTSGDNTVQFEQDGVLRTVTGYAATPGYDLASGLGTVDAAALVPELAVASPRR